ncbi:hypothetical protein BN1708_016928, partial [Verticillium longisporum]
DGQEHQLVQHCHLRHELPQLRLPLHDDQCLRRARHRPRCHRCRAVHCQRRLLPDSAHHGHHLEHHCLLAQEPRCQVPVHGRRPCLLYEVADPAEHDD